jgi:hypothetical protein
MKKNFAFLERVISKFTKVATSQEMKGLDKYGEALNPLNDAWDWLNMAEEEMIDGYKYLVAERTRRDFILVNVLNGLRNQKSSLMNETVQATRLSAMSVLYDTEANRKVRQLINDIEWTEAQLLRLTKNIILGEDDKGKWIYQLNVGQLDE